MLNDRFVGISEGQDRNFIDGLTRKTDLDRQVIAELVGAERDAMAEGKRFVVLDVEAIRLLLDHLDASDPQLSEEDIESIITLFKKSVESTAMIEEIDFDTDDFGEIAIQYPELCREHDFVRKLAYLFGSLIDRSNFLAGELTASEEEIKRLRLSSKLTETDDSVASQVAGLDRITRR